MPNHELDYELHECPQCGEEEFRTPALKTEGVCSECGYEGFLLTCCGHSPVAGAIWPMDSDGDGSLPFVERCDECAVFENDEEAARAVAAAIGSRVMWAERNDQPEELQPFVCTAKELTQIDTSAIDRLAEKS